MKNNIYKGDIEITESNQKEWEKKLKGIVKITGDLSIHGTASLPQLKSVGSYLSIYGTASLPQLESVGGDLSIYGNASLPQLESVGGYLYIHSTASLPQLESVGGYLSIDSKIDCELEKRLWKHNAKNQWNISHHCSDWLIQKKKSNFKYWINNVEFEYELFNQVRKDKLTAEQVFAIENAEQRRIAYEMMDKAKMKQLKDYKVLDEVKDDGYGYPMQIVSFSVEDFDEPFYFLQCRCPSTGREYLVETRQKTCAEAKQKSFGLTSNFDKEY